MSPRFAGAALLALACLLGSCSTLKTIAGVTISQKGVALAVQAFDAAETAAAAYLRLPDCAAGETTLDGACKQHALLSALIKDVRAARAARDSLWAASKADPKGVGVKAAYQAVIAATAAVKHDLTTRTLP